MKKRLLALILCLVMVIGLVPTTFAAATDGDGEFGGTLTIYLKNSKLSEDETTIYTTNGVLAKDVLPKATDMPRDFYGWYYYETCAEDEKVRGTDALYGTNHVLNIYAKYVDDGETPDTPATYKIVLHTGVATMDTKIDATVNVAYPLPNLSRTGYTLKGWSATEGGIIEWNPGDSVLLREAPDTGKFHVYAIWEKNQEPAESYKVIYHKTADAASDTKYGRANTDGSYTLADYKDLWTLPEGKTFVYWVDSGFGNVYTVDTTLKLNNHDLELYPVFKDAPADTHTVTFYCWNHADKSEKITLAHNTKIVIDPNGGEFWYGSSYTSKTQSFYLTADYTIANAARKGYTFYGWEAVRTGVSTVTFTARWSKDYPDYRDYSVYYYDYDDGKYEYAYFNYGDTLIFDANGGSAKLNNTKFTGTKTVNVAQSYTLSDAERAGYTFYGWDLTKSGSKYYFTAMWAKKSGVPYMLNGVDHYAYIKGYPNGTIRPDATITRAEVATIFYRLLTDTVRKSYGTSYNTFKDVPANAWYNTAVSTMANLGIITGDANGYFRPSDPITRAELAAMIARCDGGYYTGSGYYFSDTRGHWAADYIARAYDLGWINGYGDSYAPDRQITRAETMAVLNRVLERNPQYTSDLLSGMNTFSDNQKTSAWYYLDVQEATNSHTYTRKTNGYEYWNKLIANPSWY